MEDKKTVAFIMPKFESSMYAKVHRGIGKLGLAAGIVLLVLLVLSSDESRWNGPSSMLSIMIILASSFSCYFIGFLIDKLHEIAFYSKITAEASCHGR